MAVRDEQDARLDRIEEKIDKLSEAMIHLARAEEKLIAIERSNQNQFERINRLSAKIDAIQDQVNSQAAIVNVVNKVFWIAIVAVAGAVATSYYVQL